MMRRAGRIVAVLVLGVALVEGAYRVLDACFPFPFEKLERASARVVVDRKGEPLRIFLPVDGIARWPAPPAEGSSVLARALVASEDRWLGWHPGVNPLAVARAAWTNLRAGRIVSGASTIPMQLARLAEPRPRTFASKLAEAFRAVQLTRHVPTEEILRRYLDLAPFGANLEGVGAAAWFWFGKRPAELSLGESALLTALPRAPAAYDPRRHPEAARRARDRVLDQLAARGAFDAAALARARRQPLPSALRPTPFTAPHFARWVDGRHGDASRLETTLDAALQRRVASHVSARVDALRRTGIGNAAVVVLENETRAIRALVGSASFFERARPGQVNGATARRSPGSTLKPWLYAQAIDDGLVVPDSVVLDVPSDFAGYTPENYDGTYRGRVTLREALSHSLNVPAVGLLARVGVPPFLELLHEVGFTSLDRAAAGYGLPLVLGGGEVTLLELTNAYATLAEGGLHREVAWRPDLRDGGRRVLHPGAVARVTEVLREVERPDLPRAASLARDVPEVAWKTGTSYGHRDAWAVGFSSTHSIGVWVGNLDGSPRPGISGAEHAAPLLFDLFRSAEADGARLPHRARSAISQTPVCALSHELPGPWCPARIRIPTLRGVSRLAPCTHHRRIFVDAGDGARLEGDCLASRPHRPRIVTLFPAALRAWWAATGQESAALPALHPSCKQIAAAAGPQILSPDPRTPYRSRNDAPAAYQKLRLSARAAAGTNTLYWYQDGTLVGSGRPERAVFVELEPGSHRIVVMDDAGRSDRVEYRVEGALAGAS
jgi:penicillin-binding protein 1C